MTDEGILNNYYDVLSLNKPEPDEYMMNMIQHL